MIQTVALTVDVALGIRVARPGNTRFGISCQLLWEASQEPLANSQVLSHCLTLGPLANSQGLGTTVTAQP